METPDARWDDRFDRVVVTLLWITLAIAVFAVFWRDGPIASSYTATALASVYVLVVTVLPVEVSRRRLVQEAAVLAGSVLTMTAVAISGDVSSPFLLVALMPILYSGGRGGLRAGIGAAALSTGILASSVIPADDPQWLGLVQWSALLFLVGVTFSYARRLLTEEGNRSNALAAASANASARLERLENAHRLLTRLAERAETAELNPIETGTAALNSVRSVVPFEAATISLTSETGRIAVARMGDSRELLTRTELPIRAGNRDVGALVVGTDRPLSQTQIEAIEAVLQPATLAFSNILLLQSIARTAIREERTRLARGLHDDIGPSLASLGLALDLAAIQYPTEPALGAHLHDLRNSVGKLVEDVRSTVTDLRAPDDALSLRDSVRAAMGSRTGDTPSILFQVDERQHVRPSIATDVNAIVTEALRNAVEHSEASSVTVRGLVDFASGWIEVRDNGIGFASDGVADTRYGLIGMRERADSIGAELSINTDANGTSVTLRWSPE